MKLQITPASLRIRVGEGELDALLRGERLGLAPVHRGRTLVDVEVVLAQDSALSADGQWRVSIDRGLVEAYAATLPRRDPLVVDSGEAGLQVEFEVDVRESIARRGALRRHVD